MLTTTPPTPADPVTLSARWAALKAELPHLRIADAADRLGVSEAELLTLDCGRSVTRLIGPAQALLAGLEQVGEVMALTRNRSAVIEKVGRFCGMSLEGPVGLVLDTGLDLRLFFSEWVHFFAVVGEARGKPLHSVQVFDASGRAVIKIYRRAGTLAAPWDALLARLASDDQSPGFTPAPPAPVPPEPPTSEVDVEAFRLGWTTLTDTHQFQGLLRRHGLSRTQALRLAPEGLTEVIPVGHLSELMARAAQRQLPIMVFVGNAGALEIHTGPISRWVAQGGWLNVLDPGFNLHLREADLHELWVVKKPTSDGIVTSVEAFDAQGGLILQLFGARKPGQPEREDWRELLAELTHLRAA